MTVLVVLVLLDGPQRFSRLRAQIGGVAPKVLTQTLRTLERDGIVTRTAFAEIPPRVEYALTPLGRSLEQPIRAVTACAEANMAGIAHARVVRTTAAPPDSLAKKLDSRFNRRENRPMRMCGGEPRQRRRLRPTRAT